MKATQRFQNTIYRLIWIWVSISEWSEFGDLNLRPLYEFLAPTPASILSCYLLRASSGERRDAFQAGYTPATMLMDSERNQT
jgi:hypothetical protein